MFNQSNDNRLVRWNRPVTSHRSKNRPTRLTNDKLLRKTASSTPLRKAKTKTQQKRKYWPLKEIFVKNDKKISKQFCPVRQTKHVSTKHTMEKDRTAEDFQLLGTAMLQKPELKVRNTERQTSVMWSMSKQNKPSNVESSIQKPFLKKPLLRRGDI